MSETRTETLLDNFLLGLLSYLDSNEHVHLVRCRTKRAARDEDIRLWEQKHLRKLPDDLRQFYRTFDGFSVEWDVKIKDAAVHLGRIAISPLSQLNELNDDDVKALLSSSQARGPPTPITPPGESKETVHSMYTLDSCDCCGVTCIAFGDDGKRESKGYSIRFLSTSGEWFFLAPSLANYLRLAAVHIGIQEWPVKLTTGIVSSHLRVWYSLFLSTTQLVGPLNPPASASSQQTHLNVLNTAKLTALFNSTGKAHQDEKQDVLVKKKQNR